MNKVITPIFYPILYPVFRPMNVWLSSFYMPWARIVALAFFFGTMFWVGAVLKKEYVNLDAPGKHLWTDLRVWTVLSMLPHVIVYFYF